jgi:tetratricopeptide (TPR) repeat protein
LPSLDGEFVWDDDANIVDAAALRTLEGLRQIWLVPTATMQYYPLTHTTFWIELHVWGLNPLPYHVANIALHATTAVVALAILRRLLAGSPSASDDRAFPAALLGALLFAVHPLQAESVAWIIERKNCLAGAMSACCCLVYLRFAGIGEADEHVTRAKRVVLWAGALVLFALALASKTAVVGLPIVLLVMVAYKRGASAVRAHVLFLLPFVVLSFFAARITASIEIHELNASGVAFAWTFAQRLLIAGRAIWFYLGRFILPDDLMFIYPSWDIDTSHAVPWLYPLAALVGGAALVGAVARGKAPRGALIAILAYGALIAPALGFVNVYFMRFAFAQNHFQYFAALPVAALLGCALVAAGERMRRLGNARAAVAAALVLSLASLSAYECLAFRDVETLFTRAIGDNPDAWMAHFNLAHHHQQKRRYAEAARHYREVLRLRPEDTGTMTNLAVTLLALGRVDDAVGQFEAVARKNPDSADAQLNLGLAYGKQGRSAEGVEKLKRALALRPDWIRPQRILAWVLATDPDASVRDGETAVRLATDACARTKKAVSRCLDTQAAAYAEAGRYADAVATAERAHTLALETGERAAAKHISARLALYRESKPYRRERGAVFDD